MSSKITLRVARLGALTLLVLLPGDVHAGETADAPTPIRIGWQIPTATQGQIAQILKRTDVLERHGLEPRLIPFSYGEPQIEAAVAGRLDVFFAGDQPVLDLIARGGRWTIVARLMYDRVAVMVPLDSEIQDVDDLRGTTVASPLGSVAHREAIRAEEAAGIDPQAEVTNADMDILEIRRRVLAGGDQSWSGMDAAVVWEPLVSRLEKEGIARPLTETRTLGVVAVADDFIANDPEATVQLLVAVTRAWSYFARNPERVTRWYVDDAQLGYEPETLLAVASTDPNFNAVSARDVDLGFDDEDLATLERGVAWERSTGNGSFDRRRFVDRTLLARARERIATAAPEDLQVILPSASEAPPTRPAGPGIDTIPLGVLFASMVLIALLAMEIGFRLGRSRREGLAAESIAPIATVVGAVLTLLAFVIALTFSSASHRFDARKQALLDDVNNIEKAYLRAGLLPEPHRTTVQNLVRDYVQARAGMAHAYGDPEWLQMVQRRAEALQDSMWDHAGTLAEMDEYGRSFSLFVAAINDLVASHNTRVVLGAEYRIPGFVWWSLVVASVVAMLAVGFQFGVGYGRRIFTANIALAVTFALVMLLVFDLDRAGEGLITVNQQPMFDLYQSLTTGR